MLKFSIPHWPPIMPEACLQPPRNRENMLVLPVLAEAGPWKVPQVDFPILARVPHRQHVHSISQLYSGLVLTDSTLLLHRQFPKLLGQSPGPGPVSFSVVIYGLFWNHHRCVLAAFLDTDRSLLHL